MKLGRDIDEIPHHIAWCHANGMSVSADDAELFLDYTNIMSKLVHRHYPDFLPSDLPGYLTYSGDKVNFTVPYNLVPMFPAPNQITWMVPIISSARLMDSSMFCFSGSSTFLGQLESIGDLDFCEYISEDEEIGSAFERKRSCTELRLMKVKCGRIVASDPFPRAVFPDSKISAKIANPFKIDYIHTDGKYGDLAVTNVVIVTCNIEPDPALERSFAFQEVVVGSIPLGKRRNLHDVGEFGRYANWLKDEVGKYVSKAERDPSSLYLTLKALKRALSWFLIVGLEQEVNSILINLKGESVERFASVYRAKEVENLTRRGAAGASQSGLMLPEDEQVALFSDLLQLAKNLLNTMHAYMMAQPMGEPG